jgi:ubiquinone/menaquinone biosynthesis C-methylase UbiE
MEKGDREQLLEYINAMHGLGVIQAEKISVLSDFSRVKTLLDMGGGSGVYSLVLAKKYPHLKAVIYDFPEVCGITEKFIRQFKAQSQVSLCKGNLLTDGVPQGFDAVLLSQVLHQYGTKECISILRKAYHALNKGGKLIINETLLDGEETGPLPSALFSLNMLIHTPRGSSYSGKRIRCWLQRIGFIDVKIQSSESLLALVTARKPT